MVLVVIDALSKWIEAVSLKFVKSGLHSFKFDHFSDNMHIYKHEKKKQQQQQHDTITQPYSCIVKWILFVSTSLVPRLTPTQAKNPEL